MSNLPQIEVFHKAIADGDLTKAEAMLKAGLDHSPDHVDSNGFTALYLACRKPTMVPLVRALLKANAQYDAKGEDRESPLYIAVYNNNLEAVRILLSGARVNETNGMFSETPLHIAAKFGFVPIMKLLIENNANINARTSRMETPLMLAARAGQTDAVFYLLTLDASKTITNHEGKDALYLASEAGEKGCAHLIKAEKQYLRDVKSQVDVEERNKPPPVKSTEEVMQEFNALSPEEKAELREQERKKIEKEREVEPQPFVPIEIPKPVAHTHDPLTGKKLPPCKTLVEAGYREPVQAPPGTKTDFGEVNYGGTSMNVGGGHSEPGQTVKQRPPLVSALPGDGAIDYDHIKMPEERQ